MTGRRLDFGFAVDQTRAVDHQPQKAYTQEPLAPIWYNEDLDMHTSNHTTRSTLVVALVPYIPTPPYKTSPPLL